MRHYFHLPGHPGLSRHGVRYYALLAAAVLVAGIAYMVMA